MASIEEVRAWVGTTRPRDWYGWCAALTWNLCHQFGYASDPPYPSAFAAYSATTIEGTRPEDAPPGAIHYWDYTDRAGNRYGHVAVDLVGGGGTILSASANAREYWGVHAGLISVAEQTRVLGTTYFGWSMFYGRSFYSGISTPGWAGGDEVGEEGREMNFIRIRGRTGARRGGVYAVFWTGSGYEAVFVGDAGPVLTAVTDEGQIAALQKRIRGLA